MYTYTVHIHIYIYIYKHINIYRISTVCIFADFATVFAHSPGFGEKRVPDKKVLDMVVQ